jgi:hypothetical protein
MTVIGISLIFFATEISGKSASLNTLLSITDSDTLLVSFYTHSLALVADAFHYVWLYL